MTTARTVSSGTVVDGGTYGVCARSGLATGPDNTWYSDPSMASRSLWLLCAVCLAGCESGPTYLAPPWNSGRPVVLVVNDASLGPVEVVLWTPGQARSFELGPGRSVQALVFPAEQPLGLALSECGVELGTTSPLAVEPEEVYAWAPGDSGWRPLTGSARPNVPLSYQRCQLSPFACRNWRISAFSGPPGLRSVDGLAVIDSSAAFVMLHEGNDPGTSTLARFDGVGLATVELPGPRSPFLSLSAAPPSAWTTTQDLRRLQLDKDGLLLRTETASAGLDRLAIGGSVRVAYGERGLRSLAGPLLPLDEPVIYVVIVDEGRALAKTANAVLHWDGTTWNRVLSRRPDDRIEGIGGDREALLVVDDLGTVLLYDEANRRWEPREAFFGIAKSLRYVVGLGQGRFMVVGRTGFIGLWDGRVACQIEPPEMRDFYFAQATPSGRYVFVLGRTDGQDLSSQLLRLEVPVE